MIKIATHDAKFHTDDVFAIAALQILLGKANCQVVRTRDEEIIHNSEYVVDVGFVYDPEGNRFDHHQSGGAGVRENGIPYAAFGLVWKHFGEKICGSAEVAKIIDKTIVQSVDAADNGFDTLQTLVPEIYPYDVNNLVNLYRLTWKEEGDWDDRFADCVEWAVGVLSRLIKVEGDREEARRVIISAYQTSSDKRVVMIGEEYDLGREIVMETLSKYPEPIYALLYRGDADNWQLVAMRKIKGSYESRKPLPELWRAKRDSELDQVTGVPGGVFCHRSGFMCVIKTKEGALALAQKALNA